MRKELELKLDVWSGLDSAISEKKAELDKLKADEVKLRKHLFGEFFREPREGVNSVPLANGWVLKGTHKLNRKVDESALAVVAKKKGMPDIIKAVVDYKPALSLRAYKQLPEDKRKVLDNALIIKDSPPALSIELPKRSQPDTKR